MKINAEWLGKISGHVKQSREHFAEDKRQREAAGREPPNRNIILTEREVRGDWDASRVLMTTLGGQVRPITADDLAAFRQNMRIAQKNFKRGKGGITARQVIDAASSRPLTYMAAHVPGSDARYRSDIDKARAEITSAIPVSALNGEIRFLTNAGKDSKVTRHTVIVRLNAFEEAATMVAAADMKDRKTPKQAANWLRKQPLAFDCDCERHRYFFRYLATIGGFAAGRKETGYPKIRNPRLNGVACKHVLRVMAELESSGAVLTFLTNHLARVSEYKARTTITQKQAEKELQKRGRTKIKTSEQRRTEAQRAKERRALARKAKETKETQKRKPARTPPVMSPRERANTKRNISQLAKAYDVSPEALTRMLEQLAAGKAK